MKKHILLSMSMCIALFLTAQQSITLKFTSLAQDGTYLPFDVVNVTNVTRGWTETVIYPDTTMVLTSYDGIYENFNSKELLSDAFPNPFSGKTNLMLNIGKSEYINATVLNINGRVLSNYNDYLEQGSYQISIDVSNPQIVFVVLNIANNRLIKKIVNIGYGENNNIVFNKVSDESKIMRKVNSGGEFVIGDVMSYVATLFNNGHAVYSNTTTQAQFHNETITLTFPINKPSINTSNVTDITTSTATCGGEVTSSGDGTVSARGVCWSTSQNPTINNSHTTNGSGIGTFISSITGLTANTTYYVRAYATNEAGTAYGMQKTFTTQQVVTLPTITTNNVTGITQTTAMCGGNVVSSGGGTVSARGVCWSINQNPTINNSHTSDGNGMGSFTSSITGLTANITYYVRAYATNQEGTAYGEQKTFSTLAGSAPQGVINGLFTINDNGDQVYFSKGNLQYRASNNTWRFAENQYDYVGSNNSNISSSYSGWIDLFGWGTSGYNHGALNYQPWSTEGWYLDYLAYGDAYYNLYDQTGQADWGYNAINNGGNNENQWRTLTADEWTYVFDLRTTNSGIRYAKATVNGVNGFIITPDNWNDDYYVLNNPNPGYAPNTDNIISAAEWSSYLQIYGAVFLPATGYRWGTQLYHVDEGYYWSSSYNTDDLHSARCLYFPSSFSPDISWERREEGLSVRLVKDAE